MLHQTVEMVDTVWDPLPI